MPFSILGDYERLEKGNKKGVKIELVLWGGEENKSKRKRTTKIKRILLGKSINERQR